MTKSKFVITIAARLSSGSMFVHNVTYSTDLIKRFPQYAFFGELMKSETKKIRGPTLVENLIEKGWRLQSTASNTHLFFYTLQLRESRHK